MAHRIYIIEDHAIMRDMIREFLESENDLQVCGSAATAEAAFADLEHLDADLILVDTSLPHMSGIELVSALWQRSPGVRCLMYSGHREPSYVEQALEAGASGYVLKGSPSELPRAIRQVMGGERYVSEILADEA